MAIAEAGRSPAQAARGLVPSEEIAELGFADWLAPERALVGVRTIDAHRRAAKPPGPRELVDAFFRIALPARDLEAQQGRQPSTDSDPARAGQLVPDGGVYQGRKR
ncbi:MAG: hypothetical protein ACRDL3_10810 [Solirubrobacterales bacterium]